MSAKYQMAAKHLERQAQEQKAAQRQQRASRRRSGSAARDKEPGYSLPQIVITTEGYGTGVGWVDFKAGEVMRDKSGTADIIY